MTPGRWIPLLFGVVICVFIAYWFIAALLGVWAAIQTRRAVRKQDYTHALQISQFMLSVLRIGFRPANWWAFQAEALLKLARYEEALAAAEHAVTLAPRSTRGLIAKTYALLSLRKLEEAEVIVRQALAHVKNVRTWTALGSVLAAQYRMLPAVDAFRAALALIPASTASPPSLLPSLAVALSRLGRFDEALEIAKRAVAEHPGAIATLAYAQALVGVDRVDEAIELLTQQIGPKYASQAQSICSVIAYRRHDDAQAVHLALSQIEKTPQDARLWARLALAETRLEHLANAERALTAGEQLGQDDYLLLAAQGALSLAQGDASGALRMADAALGMAPLDVDLRAIRESAQQSLTRSRDA